MTDSARPTMAELQESSYGADRDYVFGSPHLAHEVLRAAIESDLRMLVREQLRLRGQCAVLEVGAGHGTFTDTLLQAGARVTVTEMSEPSAALLRDRFVGEESLEVVYDPSGTAGASLATDHHIIVMISVLHHIPDYISAVRELITPLPSGSSFYSTQDPLWHPSRSRFGLVADRTAYLAWRLGQGDYSRGLSTFSRRLRGVYDETRAEDMVEYHVIRQGVNEEELAATLLEKFESVKLSRYWSTQAPLLQRIGDRMGLVSNFGLTATGGSADVRA